MLNKYSRKCKTNFSKLSKSKIILTRKLALFFSVIGLWCVPVTGPLIISPVKADLLKAFTKNSFVAEALARSGPAVVTLETQRRVFSNSSLPPGFLTDPYLQRFFGLPDLRAPREHIERGQGSGVIFAADGLVLTNAHVIEQTDRVMIGMSDGRRIPGRVIGQDSITDLAVIQLEGAGPWPTAPLGNSDNLEVGDWAIAVGNPYGLENTVTLGIISNLNRNVTQLGISGKRLELIQTDAAINPGNSGGPLLNAKGEVVGINMLVRSGPGAGLGFAIPINRAREIAKQLVTKGKASHPIIGVSLSSISNENNNFNKAQESGAKIRYVIPGSPADQGGLQINDVIISIEGELMEEPENVVSAINQYGANQYLSFKVRRRGKDMVFSIKPIDMSDLEMFKKKL